MNDTLPNELAVLSNAHRALAQAKTVEEVKGLRDKVEAARKYAQCAKLGLETQNKCAEFKLSCERKAGRLLIELGMGSGRPGRSKKSHHGTFLADLGINKNQSSRWQQEAKISEEILQVYVTRTREKGKEITAQGLLRLAQEQKAGATNSYAGNPAAKVKRRRTTASCQFSELPSASGYINFRLPAEVIELVQELFNHHNLLSDNLREFCEQDFVRPKLIQRRTVARILVETTDALTTLFGLLQIRIVDRTARQSVANGNTCDCNAR